MADFSVDAAQLLQSVFGATYSNVSSNAVLAKNRQGVPVLARLSIPRFGYKIRKGDVIEQLFFEAFEFTPVLLLSARQEKNIVKTPVQGRNGTVKELISDGDWQVSIKGIFLADDEGNYPYEQVARIEELRSVPASFPVESEMLNLFGIYSMAIESLEFFDTEATPTIQAFSMNCTSDNTDIDLKIRQGL
jgi:hypothetical protein